MRHIAILLHKYDSFKTPYFLREIGKIWHESGLRVTVLQGLDQRVHADLAILHVDLTIVPPDYVAFIRQYHIIINGRITDISKCLISANIVSSENDCEGPVIVKTNWNCGGVMETRLGEIESRQRSEMENVDHMPRTRQPRLPVSNYSVFASSKQVPKAVWNNPELVVERFLPEKHNGNYCLRTWMFLGDKETNSISYSEQPIVKSRNVIRRETVSEVPDELRQLRQDMGFDYGKFDYVINDGQVVLYDMNRTPSLGTFKKERLLPNIRLLADGIRAYL